MFDGRNWRVPMRCPEQQFVRPSNVAGVSARSHILIIIIRSLENVERLESADPKRPLINPPPFLGK